MKKLVRKMLPFFGDHVFNWVSYAYLHLKYGFIPPTLNLREPKGLNDKIIWLKINYRHENAGLFADKVKVKNYIRETIGSQFIIETLGIYKKWEEVNFDQLPESFVLKANHGSGWNIMVRNKNELDFENTFKIVSEWTKENYYWKSREYQYKNISPRILVERFLINKDGSELRDYKFFCFNGEPKVVQVDVDRHTLHKRNFYDLSWNRLHFISLYPSFDGEIKKPATFNKMVSIARKLSVGFPFLRVDLYESNNKIFFGELTFHHGCGFEPIIPREWDLRLGSYLDLPEKNTK